MPKADLGRAVLVLAFGLGVSYLLGTFVAPQTVPRLTVLPEPPTVSFPTPMEECGGPPNTRMSYRTWERNGVLWDEIVTSTLGTCLTPVDD